MSACDVCEHADGGHGAGGRPDRRPSEPGACDDAGSDGGGV